MARRHVYFLSAVVSAAAFAVLLVVANNFYWGASQAPGGDYYLFRRPLPYPFGPILWAVTKPLLLATPLITALATYAAVRSWRDARAPGLCRTCGYDLRATPGRCPECGAATVAP
jgi:hypothetical protein